MDGTIKGWLIKSTRSEKIFIKGGFTGYYSGVVARSMKHPASGIFGDTNKDTRDSLLKVPSTRRGSSWVRAGLVEFANSRAAKDA